MSNYQNAAGLGGAVPSALPMLGQTLDRLQVAHSIVSDIDGIADKLLGTLPPRPENSMKAVPAGAVGSLRDSVDALTERLNVLRDRLSDIA